VQHDVFLADCPARTTLRLISDTWAVVVVHGLADGLQRYSQLQARIGGISRKMLTQTLRRLQDNGLVARHTIAAAPPGAQYELTELGITLVPTVRALSRWAEDHTDQLLQAQAAPA
jgi:DNA-binding HxlR family transcriptional regulator